MVKLQRMSRLEEEEKNQIEMKKRKFFAEILNAAREFQLQTAAVLKRRKQRNDGVQVWLHVFKLVYFLRLHAAIHNFPILAIVSIQKKSFCLSIALFSLENRQVSKVEKLFDPKASFMEPSAF